ncbi:restriction endonuclease [Solwaraspora sp. WMMA2080]|uniref:McrC family protein n=1 Tax=unclassified Solwaraspora TaxID=2627926 RepID=UPI00248CD361|nr:MULTISPECIES: restriction endonuclease [unclassified Solwaraspora]WBB95006.1 restriction endonuclease [Solwaraspora sp. WMMA2059]WBC21111.1 restriction endonuclease [Solwaraspora sp. WMMA2080]
MRLLSLGEHQTRDYDPVPKAVAEALAATGLVRVSATLDGRLRLRAGSRVGVVRVHAGQAGAGRSGAGQAGSEPAVEVRVRPKLPIGRLMWLLGYADDQRGWRDESVGLAEETDLVPAMAVAFTAACSAAFAAGVLQGYQVREEALPVLRGRIREADQVRRRLGFAPPLEVRYDDYTVDITENRILLAAAHRLQRLPGVPAVTRHALHRIVAALADVTPLPAGADLPAGAALPTTRVDRLTARYQPALRLARLILAGNSVEQPPGPFAATGFVFDLNAVFESWLTAMLRDSIESRYGGRLRAQHQSHLDTGRRIGLRPDITWWDGSSCRAVVDAKYKSTEWGKPGETAGPGRPPNSDMYQMLAYCTTYGLSCGHLVYAAGGPTSGSYQLTGAGIRVDVHPVDLSAPIAEIRQRIHALGTAVAEPAG